MAPNFADSAWKTGGAPFGYGGVGERTKIGYGSSPTQKHTTTYFRMEFFVDNPEQVSALTLELVADDGAIAYLNGVMVIHPNMPGSGVRFNTLPSACGNAIVTTAGLNPNLLVQGKNVLALEQHQCDAAATNLIVDASLSANLLNGRPKPAGFLTKLPTVANTLAALSRVAPSLATPQPLNARLPVAPQGQQWHLRWSDEFDGIAVDGTKWKINNLTRSEDPNKTWYLPQNVSVSDGTLKLQVKQEAYNGVNFTGGMVESTGEYRRNRYGYYEARIKYDFSGPGFWANFWMCGVDRWPPEFDNEIVTHQPGQLYLANHYRDSTARHRSTNTFVPLDYNQWHTYAVLWLPDQPVQFFVDGDLAFTAESPVENPPTIDMYVSLRAGAYYNSGWGGLPDSTTRYPGLVEYDYVRVYEVVAP